MERIGTTIGQRTNLSTLVVGGVILAGVTSLPNAVAAIYLARHGRGAAALSTAMHSNTINVIVGLIIPALFIGLGSSSQAGSLLALWYLGFTVVTLVVAYWRKGLGRISGALIVAAYLVCLWTMIQQ
jgi:cation:H+ antiporter